MSRRNEFEVAARRNVAKAIKRFRTAMRGGDCLRARRELDFIEGATPARRATKWQLQDQYHLACKRRF